MSSSARKVSRPSPTGGLASQRTTGGIGKGVATTDRLAESDVELVSLRLGEAMALAERVMQMFIRGEQITVLLLLDPRTTPG